MRTRAAPAEAVAAYVMTGDEIRAHRKALGLSPKNLALRANISCSSVKYWDQKAGINSKCRVVKRIALALADSGSKAFLKQYARTGGGVLPVGINVGET